MLDSYLTPDFIKLVSFDQQFAEIHHSQNYCPTSISHEWPEVTMNTLIHPDVLYEINRLYQKERLALGQPRK